MAINGITNITLQQQTLSLVKQGQTTMAQLQAQLASGKKNTDLSAYSASNTRQLLDLRSTQARRENYQDVITTLTPRVKTQTTVLEGLQTLISNIKQTINTATNADSATTAGLEAQSTDSLDQVNYYLNQKIDGRFIFSGTRYTTAPVADLNGLTSPPVEAYPFTPVAAPAVPVYDTAYNSGSPSAAIPSANAKDTVTIDDGLAITYGISSNDPAIQKMIQGLRYAYAASQDPANYKTLTDKANALLTDAQQGIRNLEAQNAANQSLLKNVSDRHETYINLAKSDQDTIQKADINEVAAKITILQAQIEASYAATARITQLSILNYLS